MHELGDFSIVAQLIFRLMTTEHHNKQFVTQGLLLTLIQRTAILPKKVLASEI